MLTGSYSVIDCSPCVCLALLILVSWVMDVLCLLNFISNIYIIHEHFSHGPLGLWLPRLPFLLLLLWARPILLEAFYFSLVERDKHVDDLSKLVRTKNVA